MLRTHHSVREYILEGIESGRFPPGFRLPTERALCDTLSVTRSTVRNALAVLEGEGLIIRAAGSGTYVAEKASSHSAGLGAIITSPAQVMEARLAFEPQMAQLVAANGTAADFARFQECVERGRQRRADGRLRILGCRPSRGHRRSGAQSTHRDRVPTDHAGARARRMGRTQAPEPDGREAPDLPAGA
jgi:DNA-binding FadR family transcriptional regulator